MTQYVAMWKPIRAALLLLILMLPSILNASSPTPKAMTPPGTDHATAHEAHGDEDDVSTVLLHHVMDSKEWEIIPGLFRIHLPRGLTVHSLMVWIAVAVIAGLFICGTRQKGVKVKGLSNVLEMMVLFVRDDIVYPAMGKKLGEKWLPFFVTLFMFLLVSNFLGLIPLFRTSTGNFSVTSALAIIVLVILIGGGMASLGGVGFFRNMYPSGAPAPIGLLVLFLEFVGLFIKSLVLSLRLFANMLAGHLVILSLLSLIFILSPLFCSISVPLAVFVYTLEILVAVIQAAVFTLLSCIFISMAVSSH